MAKDFTFKQFHINAIQCGMPVSTDSVLLGAWANIENARSILDIGCGSGLLSLMCAQRNPLALITAVEIEVNAFNAAQQNIKNSPWASRLTIKHSSVSHFEINSPCFDAIICNPPYFNNGEVSHSRQRAMARHTTSLSHQQLLAHCQVLLNDNGSAHFVLPKVEGLALIKLIDDFALTLQLSRLSYIKTTITKPASRVLIELTKQTTEIACDVNELVIHDGQQYSQDFIDLTHAFYLKM